MAFLNASSFVREAQQQSLTLWLNFFTQVSGLYDQLWAGKDTSPLAVVARIGQFGTSAQQAFALHAAAVKFLADTAPLIESLDPAVLVKLQSLGIPAGWTVTPSADGSMTVTPPTP